MRKETGTSAIISRRGEAIVAEHHLFRIKDNHCIVVNNNDCANDRLIGLGVSVYEVAGGLLALPQF